jgi:hypothetical protein
MSHALAKEGGAAMTGADEADRRDGAAPANVSLLFRAVNDRILALEGARAIGDYDFVCECADDTCTSPVRMTAEQYEALRSTPGSFAVLPGHHRSGTDVVVERGDGYVTIVQFDATRSPNGRAVAG